MENTSRYQQLVKIQEFVIGRNNLLSLEFDKYSDTVPCSEIYPYFTGSLLVNALYDGINKTIEQMLESREGVSEFSVVMIIAYLVGQIVMANALSERPDMPKLATYALRTEINYLIEYFTTNYTGKNILPSF